MKKTLMIIAALLLISVSFSGCDAIAGLFDKKTDPALGEKSDSNKISYENAEMKYVSSTSNSLTVEIVNNTVSTWQSGNMKDYSLEAEKDGEWYSVKQIGEFANTMELIIFAPGEKMTHTFKFDSRYGKLTPGKYRVVKSWWANATETTAAGEFHLVCEFTVE